MRFANLETKMGNWGLGKWGIGNWGSEGTVSPSVGSVGDQGAERLKNLLHLS